MASPPYNHNYSNTISSPYSANSQLPPQPKRRSSDMPTSAPSIKRRKTSMMSTTSASSVLHPLRQTSFPPEIAPAYARSPSVDTASLVSGSGTGGTSKKKRASGKKKTKKEREAEDTASLLGGTAPSALSGTGKTKGKRRASDAGQEIEEEDEEDDENAVTSGATEAERAQERENRSLLIRQLDSAQFERYEAWRLSRLPDAQMRRLMNQTLSQSVPAQVILAMRAITKMFAGDLIEGARKVQAQFIEAGEDQVLRQALPSPPTEGDEPKEAETRRGPLTPDHIRESLRRYKVSREGGSVGFLGVWQQQQSSGVERFGIKTGGKRLFK